MSTTGTLHFYPAARIRYPDQTVRRFGIGAKGTRFEIVHVRLYLAERIGLEVVQKRASDLMTPWVGETEAQIAGAFAEARQNKHFLVFDEADSLLSDRRFAQRSWEISQVNEMLTWMENHPLPFACTTNYGEHLDPATLRRFDFKLRLDYLAPDQAVAAFRTFFELDPPLEVRKLAQALWQGVTYGDWSAFWACDCGPNDDDFDFSTKSGSYVDLAIRDQHKALMYDRSDLF